MKKIRKKISEEVEAEILFKSNRLCCVDQKRGDHIHHIDNDCTNSDIENLALLCFDCHNEASIKGSLRKKLTAKTILKYRDHHYKTISLQRGSFIKKLNHPIQKLTSEDLFNAAKEAIIILEIEKLKMEYFNANWGQRSDILDKFSLYENHNSLRTAYEILSFLVRATYGTRSNMPVDIASKIYFLVDNVLDVPNEKLKMVEKVELGIEALRVSLNMFYDSIIHLKNLEIAQWALFITKTVNIYSKKEKLITLSKKVNENYEEFERHMIRPERTDLENAKILTKINKEDLKNDFKDFPDLPDYLREALYNSNKLKTQY